MLFRCPCRRSTSCSIVFNQKPACVFLNQSFVWIARSYSSCSFSFLRNSILFSIVAALTYIPTNSEEGFPFLHTREATFNYFSQAWHLSSSLCPSSFRLSCPDMQAEACLNGRAYFCFEPDLLVDFYNLWQKSLPPSHLSNRLKKQTNRTVIRLWLLCNCVQHLCQRTCWKGLKR